MASISGLDCRVTILQGRNLVAKDRNLFGKKTTSDPYVEVWAVTGRSGRRVMVGKTAVQCKTLNPVWNQDKSQFSHSFVLSDKKKTTITTSSSYQFQLLIWDHDKLSSPESPRM